MQTLLQYHHLPGSHQSTWTAGSIITYNRRDLRFKAPCEVYVFMIVPGFLHGLPTFCTNFHPNYVASDKKVRGRSTDSFWALPEDESLSLQTLQNNLTSAPVLSVSQSECTYTLDTDTCHRQAGCYFLQKQPNEPDKPIGYWSRPIDDADCSDYTTPKEILQGFESYYFWDHTWMELG